MSDADKLKKPQSITPVVVRSALIESLQRKVAADLERIAAPLQSLMKAMEPTFAFIQTMNRQMEMAQRFVQIAEARRGYLEMLRPIEFIVPPPPRQREVVVVHARLTEADKREIADYAARTLVTRAATHPGLVCVIIKDSECKLYRQDDHTRQLSFRGALKRASLIDALSDRQAPVPLKQLVALTGFKSEKALTNAIGTINRLASPALVLRNIPEDYLITPTGRGYLINRKYLIIPER